MSEPNWINLWDKLKGAVRSGAHWVDGKLLSPAEVTVSGVGQLFTPGDFQLSKPQNLHSTVSGTYATSELAQQYGADNIKFYQVEGSNQLNEVPNRRISVIVRKYNDGSIGLLFYDHQSGLVVIPGNLNLNENITGSIPKNNGEFVIRNGGSTSPDDPLFGDQTIDRALSIFTSSSSLNTPPEPPQPTPPEQKQQTFQTSKLNISFTQMKGTTASPYSGDVIVKQEKTPGKNYYIINFYDTNGDKLGVADNNTSRQIWRSLWSGGDSGYKIPDSYLIEGDGDALGWLNRAFEKTPTPAPRPPPEPVSIFQTNTNEYKILFKDSSGNTYSGGLDIRYQFDNGKWDYRVKKQGTNDYLTLTGDGVNITRTTPDGFPVYDLDYEDGTSFQDSFQSAYGGAPPDGPAPVPPAELKKIQINLTKGQTAIEAFNWDGTKSTPADSFTIHLEEQPDGSYQVYATGGSTDPNHNVGGRLWVNLSYTGLKLNRLENGNWEIPAGQIPEGATAENVQQFFMNSYQKQPEPTPDPTPDPDPTPGPEPTPTPGPTGLTRDRKVGRINTDQHAGLKFLDSNGKQIEDDNIELYTRGDIDGDGKNEIYFLTVRGEPVSIEKVNGYDYDDFPEEDTTGTGRRRLPGGDLVLYDIDAGIDNLGNLFENGFGARERETTKELNLLESLPIKAFILYNRKGKEGPKITNKDNRMEHLWITGVVKHDINGLPKFYDLSDMEEKKNDIEGKEGADEEKEGFSGTFESRGGERAPERFDLYSPPDLCGGTGRGRRLMECGPDEPAPEYNELKNRVSKMELLNFERNRMENDERDLPDYTKTQFERMRNTDNERELISMYGTFSSASYIPEDKRPESLFGLDYDEKHSTHNMATYIGRGRKNGIISIRGTKPGNIVDLASDALILTGYEESLSVRFEQSLRDVKNILDSHDGTKFTLSSHSLGGAINEFIINELKGTKYEDRIKAISFNPGKAPNVKTKRAKEISELVTDASVIKALKEQDPRFLPIMGSIQRDLGISSEMLTNPDIMTNEQEMGRIIQNYPRLTESFNRLMGRLGNIGTLEGRTAEARSWIAENEQFLGRVNYTASIGNIIKTKIMFDLMLKLFDFSANFTIDQFLERESEMDRKMGKAVKPYNVLWSEGNNVIFKYKNDPISLHHSFFEDEKQNVRTYKGKHVSVLNEGIQGKLGQGLKEHGMDNFLIDSHKELLDHSENWEEYFSNLLNDNVESFSEILNGIRTKLNDKQKEFIREHGWADFLGLF